MFVSTRNQGYNRRNRVYKHKTVSFSHISILSRLTSTTGGSGDSARTITQESFEHSRREHARAKDSKRTRTRKRRRRLTDMQSQLETSKRAETQDIDVFEFLDQKSGTMASHTRQLSNDIRRLAAYDQDESDKESIAKSHFSDSGVSMNGSSFSSSRSQTMQRPRLQTLSEYHPTYPTEIRVRQPAGYMFNPYFTHPASYPAEHTAAQHDGQSHYTIENESLLTHSPDCVSAPLHPQPADAYPNAPPQSGYDQLASKLAESSGVDALTPLYRKFTKLNHRILLQLQDEIAEMESDLTHLDAEDARLRQQAGLPASRRMSWGWPGSELQTRRLDLLGRIHAKIEQYHQAIISAQRVANSTTNPTNEDVKRYSEWLKEHRPLIEPESKFLEQPSDLLSLSKFSPLPQNQNLDNINLNLLSTSYHPILILSLLPLLFFKLSTDLLFRTLVIALTVGATTYWAKQYPVRSSGVGQNQNRQHLFWILHAALLGLVALIL